MTSMADGRLSTPGRVDAGWQKSATPLGIVPGKTLPTGPVFEVEGTALTFSKAQPSKLLKCRPRTRLPGLHRPRRSVRLFCRSGRVQGRHPRNQKADRRPSQRREPLRLFRGGVASVGCRDNGRRDPGKVARRAMEDRMLPVGTKSRRVWTKPRCKRGRKVDRLDTSCRGRNRPSPSVWTSSRGRYAERTSLLLRFKQGEHRRARADCPGRDHPIPNTLGNMRPSGSDQRPRGAHNGNRR